MNIPTLLAATALFTSVFAVPVNAAPIVVGSATFSTLDDLTVIKDGNVTYEFLDLTSTQNMTSSSAVTAFNAYGFGLADSDDLSRLFASFGFGFSSADDTHVIMPITQQSASSFTSYLGNTNGAAVAALGNYLNLDYGMGYACIGWSVCTGNAFVRDVDASTVPRLNFGTYLVRSAADVPEPASLALFGLGMAGLTATRRRRRR